MRYFLFIPPLVFLILRVFEYLTGNHFWGTPPPRENGGAKSKDM